MFAPFEVPLNKFEVEVHLASTAAESCLEKKHGCVSSSAGSVVVGNAIQFAEGGSVCSCNLDSITFEITGAKCDPSGAHPTLQSPQHSCIDLTPQAFDGQLSASTSTRGVDLRPLNAGGKCDIGAAFSVSGFQGHLPEEIRIELRGTRMRQRLTLNTKCFGQERISVGSEFGSLKVIGFQCQDHRDTTKKNAKPFLYSLSHSTKFLNEANAQACEDYVNCLLPGNVDIAALPRDAYSNADGDRCQLDLLACVEDETCRATLQSVSDAITNPPPGPSTTTCVGSVCSPSSISFNLVFSPCSTPTCGHGSCVTLPPSIVPDQVAVGVQVTTPGTTLVHTNSEFTISSTSSGDPLPPELHIEIVNAQGIPVQFVTLKSTCEPPLSVGDVLGSVVISGFTCSTKKALAKKGDDCKGCFSHGEASPILHLNSEFASTFPSLLNPQDIALLNTLRSPEALSALFDASLANAVEDYSTQVLIDFLSCLVQPQPTPEPPKHLLINSTSFTELGLSPINRIADAVGPEMTIVSCVCAGRDSGYIFLNMPIANSGASDGVFNGSSPCVGWFIDSVQGRISLVRDGTAVGITDSRIALDECHHAAVKVEVVEKRIPPQHCVPEGRTGYGASQHKFDSGSGFNAPEKAAEGGGQCVDSSAGLVQVSMLFGLGCDGASELCHDPQVGGVVRGACPSICKVCHAPTLGDTHHGNAGGHTRTSDDSRLEDTPGSGQLIVQTIKVSFFINGELVGSVLEDPLELPRVCIKDANDVSGGLCSPGEDRFGTGAETSPSNPLLCRFVDSFVGAGFSGDLAHLSLFDRALSNEQIAEIANATTCG